jgi:hypothetical protein
VTDSERIMMWALQSIEFVSTAKGARDMATAALKAVLENKIKQEALK